MFGGKAMQLKLVVPLFGLGVSFHCPTVPAKPKVSVRKM